MRTNTLIIGAGIAGATAALQLAQDRQRHIILLSNSQQASESSSSYAQGGIVSRGSGDTPEILVQDIMNAGDGLSYPPAVELVASEGPRLVDEFLIDQVGLKFDRAKDGGFAYGLEGAHSMRRVLHMGDATGRAIMQGLLAEVRKQPNIQLLTGQTAVDLITFPHHSLDPMAVYNPVSCQGAYVFDQNTRHVQPILAAHTVLATGGLGRIYLNTSNPPGIRGDGLAMAYRAGARVINAEYVQFHPTMLHMHGITKFLISEAVRGEGGILLTPSGDPFMERYSPEWKDLAPRDVVARAIYWEMMENDYPYVLLDIGSHMEAQALRERFPQIYQRCLDNKLDITQQPIPVVPGAHYFCGGVLVDLWGRSTIPNLYAVGEVSCTGVHGANRLASTSLLEGLVWGARSAQYIRSVIEREPLEEAAVPPWDESNLVYDTDPSLIQGDMQTIRNLMWHYVGLIRSEYRLHRAERELRNLWLEIEEFYRKTRLTDGLIGLRNSVHVGLIVARAARRNMLSQGSHYREEHFMKDQTKAYPPGTPVL